MSKTKIISVLLLGPVFWLTYLLYDSINSKIELTRTIKQSEARVIEKLKVIREAEKAFAEVNGNYTANWDSLIAFVKDGEMPIVEKKEKVIPRKRDDPDYYKGDIIEVTYDTIGREPVMGKVFPKETYGTINPDDLPYIPGTDRKMFDIFAAKVEKGGLMVNVIEVVDKHPMDPTRNDSHPSRVRWFLRFGSKTEPRINGNWE
jgi:hypothetical protein